MHSRTAIREIATTAWYSTAMISSPVALAVGSSGRKQTNGSQFFFSVTPAESGGPGRQSQCLAAACSWQGQALGSRLRGNDDNKSEVPSVRIAPPGRRKDSSTDPGARPSGFVSPTASPHLNRRRGLRPRKQGAPDLGPDKTGKTGAQKSFATPARPMRSLEREAEQSGQHSVEVSPTLGSGPRTVLLYPVTSRSALWNRPCWRAHLPGVSFGKQLDRCR
jgi:hypothetical protein